MKKRTFFEHERHASSSGYPHFFDSSREKIFIHKRGVWDADGVSIERFKARNDIEEEHLEKLHGDG